MSTERFKSHVTFEWVISVSHMNGSRHIWISHVTYESVTWRRHVYRAPQKSWRIRRTKPANKSATSRLLTKAHGTCCSWPLVRCRCVAVCCSALQYVANTSATSRLLMRARGIGCSWPPVYAVCCSVLQCVANTSANTHYGIWDACSTLTATHLNTYTCICKIWAAQNHRAMSQIWMRHVTHVNESCHTYEWVMSHIWISHVTHMNESFHTCTQNRRVISQIWMSHVTNMHEWCHINE